MTDEEIHGPLKKTDGMYRATGWTNEKNKSMLMKIQRACGKVQVGPLPLPDLSCKNYKQTLPVATTELRYKVKLEMIMHLYTVPVRTIDEKKMSKIN